MKNPDLLIKIADAENFRTVAGLRTRRVSFNGETFNLGDPFKAKEARDLLEAHGAKRASFRGAGLFKDASSDALMRQTFFDGAVKNFQVVVPGFGAVEGPYQIVNLEFAGEHNGEVTYEIAMESAGALEFRVAQ